MFLEIVLGSRREHLLVWVSEFVWPTDRSHTTASAYLRSGKAVRVSSKIEELNLRDDQHQFRPGVGSSSSIVDSLT